MKIISILIWVLFALNAHSQSLFKISGKVLDENNEAIAGASVSLSPSSKGSFTDAKGDFIIKLVKGGEYLVNITSVGFEKQVLNINVDRDVADLKINLRVSASQLDEIAIVHSNTTALRSLPDISGNFIINGKKNEVIELANLNADIAQKNARQIFAKIPGVFVYDMDGAGNQVNIAARGLDPHRSWEFNVRADGVITNSDMYGYPASHYSMPMESVAAIQVVHGTSALQYGAQFGGMLNYVTKKADTDKKFSFENISSIGSFGLKSTYNAVGGKIGKLSYYGYFSKRVSDGFRESAYSNYDAEYLNLIYEINKRNSLSATIARSNYEYKIPGPLTEAQYLNNPRQNSRNRNYYTPDIYVPSIKFNSKINENLTFDFTLSAILGDRKSVQFTGVSGVADVPDKDGKYAKRQVDIDNYKSLTSEMSIKQDYQLFQKKHSFVGGIRLINNDLHRRQKGISDTDEGANYSTVNSYFGRDLNFKTQNVAFYLENMFRLTGKLAISPGIRIEKGLTKMRGRMDDYRADEIPVDIKHSFPLLGIDFNFVQNRYLRIFGGFSQAYRPVIFADMLPANPYEITDKNLKDAYGYNAELGIKGSISQRLVFDLCAFALRYNDRMGKQVIYDQNNQLFINRTNVGDALTVGLETYLEFKILKNSRNNLSVFTSTSFMNGKYLNGSTSNGKENIDLKGKQLETVPKVISRNGIQFLARKFSSTLQYSYTSSMYSDPLNTEYVANGTVGVVPAYGILDLNNSFEINRYLGLRLSLNNLTNEIYYTKRPSGYPGPGIWTSDGRSVILSIRLKL